jgi:hypothetical protein
MRLIPVVGNLLIFLHLRDASLQGYSDNRKDILLQTKSGIVGMERKAQKSTKSTNLKAMQEVASSLGKERRGGLFVYQGDILKKIAEPNIWAIPSRRLFT